MTSYNYVIKLKILLKLYKYFLSFSGSCKAANLKNPGNKFIIKGYIKEKQKPIIVSFIKWYCVFLYTASNMDT